MKPNITIEKGKEIMKTIYELKKEYRAARDYLDRTDKAASKRAKGNMLALLGSSNIRSLQAMLDKKAALQKGLEASGLSKFDAQGEIDAMYR